MKKIVGLIMLAVPIIVLIGATFYDLGVKAILFWLVMALLFIWFFIAVNLLED